MTDEDIKQRIKGEPMTEIDYQKRYAVEFRYRSGQTWYLEKSYRFLWRAKQKARYMMSFLGDLCTYRVVDTREVNG